jgi:condensin complex subunit 2
LLAARAAEADSGDEEDDGQGGEGGAEGRPKKKRTKTHTTTLADEFSKIKVKDLELEFTVDPLFKKTSADFDEGGAAGLLMNHLGSDSNMRVVFDAGDAKVLDPEDDNDQEEDGFNDDEKLPTVDISKLRGKLLCFSGSVKI